MLCRVHSQCTTLAMAICTQVAKGTPGKGAAAAVVATPEE